jgi:hypothetical protein
MVMEMAAQRCSRQAVHDILGVHGWVAAMNYGHRDHDFLLGCHGAFLHGHGPVGSLTALPLIYCLRPWPC